MRHETVVVEVGDQHGEALIAVLCVREVWLPQAETLFAIYVIDTDAQSYIASCYRQSFIKCQS